jgi:hypothetical protein
MMRFRELTQPVLPLLALLMALGGCSERPTIDPPSPGSLDLVLHTEADGGRAMQLEISGPAAIAVPQAAPDYRIYSRAEGTTRRIAVFGELRSGLVLILPVPDMRRAAEYSARVVEVADAENALLPAEPDFVLTVERRGR